MKILSSVILTFVVLTLSIRKSLQTKHAADTIDHDDPLYKKQTGRTHDELVKSGDYISPEEMFGEHWNTSDPLWKDFTKTHTHKHGPEGRRIWNQRTDKIHDGHGVIFYLHTQKNQDGTKVTAKADSLKSAGWNKKWPVKIIIHGYLQHAFRFMPTTIRKAYLKAETEANIVVVDWGAHAGGIYFDAAYNTVAVADVVAKFIETAVGNKMLKDYGKVHIIGHSLGAHLGGSVGEKLRAKGKTIGRITGLDPAGPGYFEASTRLDSSDATFVDAIHTNMPATWGVNVRVSLGTNFESGHADFYPNGGEQQPGCKAPFVGDLVGACSHRKAVHFFEESILDSGLYPSCPCQSWSKYKWGSCKCDSSKFMMGEHCSTSLAGSYYLHT